MVASRTPVVVTPVGANAEIAGAVDARFVATAATPAALAQAIAGVLASTWNGEELARACVRRFDIETVGPEYERLLGHAAAVAKSQITITHHKSQIADLS